MSEEREVTFSEKQDIAVACLRAMADGIEEGRTIIEGFEPQRDALNTGVQKAPDGTFAKTFVAGPWRVPAFMVYHVFPRGVHQ